MKIISVVGAKGGTGKSTVSLLLSLMFSDDYKTALLDCDIQSTCFSAKVINPVLPFDVDFSHNLGELIKKGKNFEKNNTDVLIIDTNPRSFLESPKYVEEIIGISDFCILPCRPAPRDIRANTALVSKISGLSKKAGVLWNFVQSRTKAHKESMKQAPDLLELHPLKNFLKQRVCYQDVFDEVLRPEGNQAAIREMESVYSEIRKLIDM